MMESYEVFGVMVVLASIVLLIGWNVIFYVGVRSIRKSWERRDYDPK